MLNFNILYMSLSVVLSLALKQRLGQLGNGLLRPWCIRLGACRTYLHHGTTLTQFSEQPVNSR